MLTLSATACLPEAESNGQPGCFRNTAEPQPQAQILHASLQVQVQHTALSRQRRGYKITCPNPPVAHSPPSVLLTLSKFVCSTHLRPYAKKEGQDKEGGVQVEWPDCCSALCIGMDLSRIDGTLTTTIDLIWHEAKSCEEQRVRPDGPLMNDVHNTAECTKSWRVRLFRAHVYKQRNELCGARGGVCTFLQTVISHSCSKGVLIAQPSELISN